MFLLYFQSRSFSKHLSSIGKIELSCSKDKGQKSPSSQGQGNQDELKIQIVLEKNRSFVPAVFKEISQVTFAAVRVGYHLYARAATSLILESPSKSNSLKRVFCDPI